MDGRGFHCRIRILRPKEDRKLLLKRKEMLVNDKERMIGSCFRIMQHIPIYSGVDFPRTLKKARQKGFTTGTRHVGEKRALD